MDVMILNNVTWDHSHSHRELCDPAAPALKQPPHCIRQCVVDIADIGWAVHLGQGAPKPLDPGLLAGLMSLA